MFEQMMSFMLQMTLLRMTFNDLPHAVGLLEPFDLSGERIRPELEIEAEARLKTPDVVGMSDPISIEEGLRQSMREEETAISKYGTRAAHARLNGDPLTADIYEKIADDEATHYEGFGTRLRERLEGQLESTRAFEVIK
jgi:hypothetical protein